MTSGPVFPRVSQLPRFVHREFVLLLALSVAVSVAFLGTRRAAASNRRQQASDAAAWYERGRARVADGRPAAAVLAFRRAAARKPDDWRYGKALVQALIADGQTAAARQLLLLWRSQRPDDGDVSAQLARLEAGAGDAAAAIEYYQGALYGRWPQDEGGQTRQALRQELIAYLLDHGQRGSALSQVLVLSANQSDDVASHVRTGRLFLDVGEPARALDSFGRAMALDSTSADARSGAGVAAFALGDYSRALSYLRDAATPPDRALAATARAVIARDPLRRGLSTLDQRRRLAAAVDEAARRLEACRLQVVPKGTADDSFARPADALAAYRRTMSARTLRGSPDAAERGITLAARAIQVAVDRCPPRTPEDDVLLRIARLHEAGE